MMTVIKRSKKASVEELVNALDRFIFLLEGQKEDEAVSDLRIALGDLQKYQIDSDEFKASVSIVVNSYEGEHELSAYTHRREAADKGDWTEADDLFLVSTKVLNLAQRFSH